MIWQKEEAPAARPELPPSQLGGFAMRQAVIGLGRLTGALAAGQFIGAAIRAPSACPRPNKPELLRRGHRIPWGWNL